MARIPIMFVVAVLILAGSLSAKQITLEQTWIISWHYKYTIDGVTWHKVGLTGNPLRMEMTDNEAALEEMDSYEFCETMEAITDLPATILIVWAAFFTDQSDPNYWMKFGGGISLWLISIVFDIIAHSHLNNAVSIHNGEQNTVHPDVSLIPLLSTTERSLTFALTWTF